MKDELKQLGVLFWRMLVEFLTSKKVMTAILTTVAAVFVKDPATRDKIVEAGLALLIGIGLTDFGKAKAIAPTTAKTVTAVDASGSGVSVTKINEPPVKP